MTAPIVKHHAEAVIDNGVLRPIPKQEQWRAPPEADHKVHTAVANGLVFSKLTIRGQHSTRQKHGYGGEVMH